MKNPCLTIKRLSWIAFIVTVFLLAAPAVSASDFPYSTYDSGLYPVASPALLGPPVVMDPGYVPLSLNYGSPIQPIVVLPGVIPVSPMIISPTLNTGNSGYVVGAYYEGSVPISSSYAGSGWDWFRSSSSGGMCGGF